MILGESEGWDRFPEGAFAALVQRAGEALGNSAATSFSARGPSLAAPEACGARSLYKGEKWRLEGTCPTPLDSILFRKNAIIRVDAHAACERHQQRDENGRVWDFNQELAQPVPTSPPHLASHIPHLFSG